MIDAEKSKKNAKLEINIKGPIYYWKMQTEHETTF